MNVSHNQPLAIFCQQYRYYLILFLFFLSGLSGLIYESIWTHYLKLILGHSAYAQTLVLVIFMGGLATGAYITSRYIYYIKNALIVYALVEGIIGIAALFFHETFLFINDILFNNIAVTIDSQQAFQLIKWSLAAILILPQSILLGTTFPLISSGVLQIAGDEQSSGRVFSLLYFNNSLGAAIGVLVSGFFLIQQLGLPGTISTGGWINIFVAISVLLLLKPDTKILSSFIKQPSHEKTSKDQLYFLMLAVAFFTGLASFFYEIAWIRMLTLILGATTHSFELMLSAFILGLALGSLWIKRRIERFKNPVAVLGYIQLLMAIFALLTLTFYSSLYDFMEFFLKIIKRNADSYPVYIFINHLIALVVMLPATFFAGMTLPLITNILFKKQNNDKVIGHVYAINTLGAISGIIIATNILLPLIGTKGLLSLGALTDIAMGLTIFAILYLRGSVTRFALISLASLLTFQVIFEFSEISPLKTSSGVFRRGQASWSEDSKVLFHKDGKLSTVDVIQMPSGSRVLLNNGKPDASINITKSTPTPDESTMILLAAIPVSIYPHIQTVANIGMGAGQTVQTLLLMDNIKLVDTVEIEQSVIESVPLFKQFSNKVLNDRRSHIHLDDAKSFLSSNKKTYDLIISEPPNPWVNGVASLFTDEFYKSTKKSLNKDGVFAQWLQLYEIDINILARIFSSLSENFKSYSIFFANNSDLFVIASDSENRTPKPKAHLFQNLSLKNLLARINIKSTNDIQARYLGDKEIVAPFFKTYSTESTSDYYPKIEYLAAKSLFKKDMVTELHSLLSYTLPALKHIYNTHENETPDITLDQNYQYSIDSTLARELLSDLINTNSFTGKLYSKDFRNELMLFKQQLSNCSVNYFSNNETVKVLHKIIWLTAPHLGKNDFTRLLGTIKRFPCYNDLPDIAKDLMQLYQANNQGNYDDMIDISTKIFKSGSHYLAFEIKEYLLASTLLAKKMSKSNIDLNWMLSAYLSSQPNSQTPIINLLTVSSDH